MEALASAIFWLKFFWTSPQPSTLLPPFLTCSSMPFVFLMKSFMCGPVSCSAACMDLVPPTIVASAPT
jgi:hypothetical protein